MTDSECAHNSQARARLSLASIAVVEKVREAGDHSLGSILLLSGAGLLATRALGIDLGAGWI